MDYYFFSFSFYQDTSVAFLSLYDRMDERMECMDAGKEVGRWVGREFLCS